MHGRRGATRFRSSPMRGHNGATGFFRASNPHIVLTERTRTPPPPAPRGQTEPCLPHKAYNPAQNDAHCDFSNPLHKQKERIITPPPWHFFRIFPWMFKIFFLPLHHKLKEANNRETEQIIPLRNYSHRAPRTTCKTKAQAIPTRKFRFSQGLIFSLIT